MAISIRRLPLIAIAALVLMLSVTLLIPSVRARLWGVFTHLRGRRTVESVLAEIGPSARARLAATGHSPVAPRSALTLVALKEERMLYVFAASGPHAPTLVKAYPILAASGVAGPKTAQGDNQVPEGVYRVDSLNPNSAFHLALRLDYPNAEDRRIAKEEDRDSAALGGDIMIHGKAASIGCLAMGDDAIEEIFTLAADVGIDHIDVLIAPFDLRSRAPASDPRRWVIDRYKTLSAAIRIMPIP